jgi:hypothetical protein
MDTITGLQLAASIAELVNFVSKVFRHWYLYYYAVRSAPLRSQDLRTQLDALVVVLKDVQETFERPPGAQLNLRIQLDALGDVLNNWQETFERDPGKSISSSVSQELFILQRLVSDIQLRTKQKSTTGLRRLLWPLTESEIIEVINKIERYKTNLVTQLQLHQTYFSLLKIAIYC